MTQLNAADQLAALMRVQIASLRRKVNSNVPARGKTSAPASAPASASASSSSSKAGSDLATLASQRIREISTDDPERERKALRAFLECVLLSELGPELVADPAFGRMVDHVLVQMESTPQLAAATAQAARALLDSADSAS